VETSLSPVDHALEREYRAVRDVAGRIDLPAGFLKLKGAEALEFLNRISTNDLRGLLDRETRPTILTTEKGRIIDVVLVVKEGADLLLIVSQGNSQNVKSWIGRFIIMEDITVEDVTDYFKRTSIIGAQAPSTIGKICPGPSEPVSVRVGPGVFLYRDPLWTLPLYHFVGPTAALDSHWNEWGAVHPEIVAIPAINERTVETIRIEVGIPAHGKELTDEVNPLEAGLSRFVSFTKGCYIGQEVIARLDTYGKIRRTLCGFVFPDAARNLPVARLLSSSVEVGWTTSHTYPYQMNKAIALGYVKGIPAAGVIDFKPSDAELAIPVMTVELPFRAAETHPMPGH